MEIYKVQSIEDITNELILSLIERYKQVEVPKLKKLHDYYIGENPTIRNRKTSDTSKPNNKIANPIASYLVDISNGFFLGKPVSYSSANNEELMSKIQDIFDKNHEQNHNSLLGKSLSIYGVGYELLYMNELNEIKLANLNPQEVFMVYSNNIEQKPLVAIRYYDIFDYITEETITHVEVYSDSLIRYYKVEDETLVLIDEHEHYFKEVPVVVFFNNEEQIGDFTRAIDLIDAYDKAVSDTSNNLEYFSDAYLVLSNIDMNEEDIATMKEKRVMVVGENGSCEWLIKNTANMEIEEFKNRLMEDIFNFTSIPNINSEKFGNATSGEALKYKLFALENFVSTKERMFKKGLEQRIKLITEILNIMGTGQYDYSEIVMSFTRNIPPNLAMLSDMVSKLVGIVSNETLLSLLPFVDDVAYEKMLLEKEREGTIYADFELDGNTEIINP